MFRIIILFFAFTACNPVCFRKEYQEQYPHIQALRMLLSSEEAIYPSDYYLVLLVDAKHLDYSSPEYFMATLAKHPNGSRTRDFGHAWILLHGKSSGKSFTFEGGHSGEIDFSSPRYLDAILEHQEDENPIRYLFLPRNDGYLENGSGGHVPTFALYVPIDEKTFLKILAFINEKNYNYSKYSLVESQCTTFVIKAASLAGIDLSSEVQLPCPQKFVLCGSTISLWRDPRYKTIEIFTPDALEKSMCVAACLQKAQVALRFYRKLRKF